MAIRGGCFESLLTELQMHTSEKLLGLIATAGKERAFESFHQNRGLEFQSSAAFHHRQFGVVVCGHAAHLIAATEAVELNLFSGFLCRQSDRRIARETIHNFTEQTGWKGDGAAAFHLCGQ